MALTFYQETGADSSANLSLTTQAGALLVATCVGNSTMAASTVSGGGTWATGLTQAVSGDSVTYIRKFYCLSATGGASTFVFNSPPSYPGWKIKEFRGATTWALDKSAQAGSPGTSVTWSSGNVTTTQANSVLVGGWANLLHDYTAWDAGWTDVSHSTLCMAQADRIVTSTGTYAASGTCPTADSSGWVAAIATFYDAGGGAASILPLVMANYRRRH